MIELFLITAVASFINISGVKASTDFDSHRVPPRPIITVEDVNNNEPESLLEALRASS